MCRHLAYVGPPIRPAELLLDPPNALTRQAWAPRRQRHGVVNADGFGLGWYPGAGAEPLRHRGCGPVWADGTWHELARSQRSRALLASVRSATEGTAHGVGAAMPFRSGRWLFAHNGALVGWPDSAVPLARSLPVERLLRLEAMTDAALLWAAVLDLLERGVPPGKAVADVVTRAAATCGGRLNLLLTDGDLIIATAWGADLAVRTGTGEGSGTVVASEPLDDAPAWRDVADRSLVQAGPHSVHVTAL